MYEYVIRSQPSWVIKSENMFTINDNAIETIFNDEEKSEEICTNCLYGFWQALQASFMKNMTGNNKPTN